jgi:hypothetical protein
MEANPANPPVNGGDDGRDTPAMEKLKEANPALLAIAIATPVGVTYVVLRICYFQFYSKLGLQPEDVGLGRAEILAQAIGGPIILAIVFALVAFLFGLWYGLLLGSYKLIFAGVASLFSDKSRQDLQRDFEARTNWIVSPLRRYLPWIAAVLGVLGAIVVLAGIASTKANEVVDKGRGTDGSVIDLAVFRLPILDVRAQPVRLRSSTPKSLPAELRRSHCLMLIGTHDSKYVLFDVRTKRVWRVSTGSTNAKVTRAADKKLRFCVDQRSDKVK